MKRFAVFVNLLFAPVSLCNTLFCVRRFARRRIIAKPPDPWQDLFIPLLFVPRRPLPDSCRLSQGHGISEPSPLQLHRHTTRYICPHSRVKALHVSYA